jgi:hypothetical protein
LETRLDADIAALGIALEAVNASIQLELDGLGDDMAEFRDEVAQGIAAILAKLDQNNQTQNENYGKLQALLNSINTTSLVEIKNQLTALKTDSDAMEAGLIAKLDDFRNRTMTKLDNLTGLMAILDDIKSLTSEVQNLKTNVDDVKDSQAGTKKTVETLAPTTWMSVVLILIVLVVAIALLLMSRGKKGNIPVPERTAGATMPARNVKQEPLPGGEGMKP